MKEEKKMRVENANSSETANRSELGVKDQMKRKNAYKANQLVFVFGWLAIPVIQWVIFYWGTNFMSIVGAFQDPITAKFSLINFEQVFESIFNGAKNYGSLGVAFENTFKYFVVNMFVKVPIQLIACYFLYKQIKGYKIFRFILYLPAILPGVALASMFKEMVAANGILAMLGFSVPSQGLLGTPATATNTILFYNIWVCICGNMLLYCGAMNRIPVEVLEAARLDGIGPFKEFVHLILPMIWPTLSTVLILACCDFLSASGPILLLASDTYSLRSTTISYWLWEKVYAGGVHGQGQYNLVSAAGLTLTAVAFPIVMLIRKAFDKLPTVEY